MLSLQSVQGEQIQALVQSYQSTNAKPAENAEKSDFSFMDLLRTEQQKTETVDEKTVSRMNDEHKKPEDTEKVAEKPVEKASDDTAQEKVSDEQKVQVSQKDDDAEKTAANIVVDGEETALIAAENPVAVDVRTFALQSQPIAQLPEEAAVAVTDEAVELIPAQIEPALNEFAWTQVNADEAGGVELLDDAVPEETVAALIQDFVVPEIDVDDDDLAKVQNLAAEHPLDFLQATEKQFVLSDEKPVLDGEGKKTAVQETKTKPRLEITDLRTVKSDAAVETEQAVGKAQQKNGADFAFEQKNEPQVQMTMNMVGAVEQNITSSSTQTAAANGSNFQSMLTNAIQENAPDFVKAGNIVLRDGNQGTINLILKPEALGNVKISLSLSDKVITGQITVQTKEAYNAFKDSIDALREAFAQNGFEAQGFDLNYAGNQNFAQNQQGWQNPEYAVRGNRTYGELVLDTQTVEDAEIYENSAYGINIVA